MGMFDDIRVDKLDWQGKRRDYQSKSLDCTMTTYIITNEGRLVYEQREWKETNKAPLGGWFVGTGEMIDTEYHGDIIFYDFGEEYLARFTDGQLLWIKSLPAHLQELAEKPVSR